MKIVRMIPVLSISIMLNFSLLAQQETQINFEEEDNQKFVSWFNKSYELLDNSRSSFVLTIDEAREINAKRKEDEDIELQVGKFTMRLYSKNKVLQLLSEN